MIEVKRASADKVVHSGVFECSELGLDRLLPEIFNKAFEVSKANKIKNVFDSFEEAYSHIRISSGNVPPAFLISKEIGYLKKKKDLDEMRGKIGSTTIVSHEKLKCRVVCARPDFVGQLTSINSSFHSIILHNLEYGLAFF